MQSMSYFAEFMLYVVLILSKKVLIQFLCNTNFILMQTYYINIELLRNFICNNLAILRKSLDRLLVIIR